jgi:Flp pilus assembly protein TadG
MTKRIQKAEEGQSIVLIAAVMVGLLALAGLAIDGGNAFLERRNTQNAADAAALAGTRQLARAICGEGATDAEVAHAVNTYAEKNGVDDAENVSASYVDVEENVLGAVGAGTIPANATGVTVDLGKNVPTFFLKVVAISSFDVSARALAMTGPPLATAGIRPIGVPLELVLALKPTQKFRLSFGNCVQQPDTCIASYTGGQIQHRGWLNLAYVWNDGKYLTEADDFPRAIDPSGDADVLKEWMERGYNGNLLWSRDYIHAKPGKNSSVIGEVPTDKPIMVPIFDRVPHYDEIMEDKPPQASQGGGYYYHIAGFLTFQVTDRSQGGGWIDGEFITAAYTGAGVVGGGDGLGYGGKWACWNHTQTVNLVR